MSELTARITSVVWALKDTWGPVQTAWSTSAWGSMEVRLFEAYLHEFGHLLDLAGDLETGLQDLAKHRSVLDSWTYTKNLYVLGSLIEGYVARASGRDAERSELRAQALVEVLIEGLGLPVSLTESRKLAHENWNSRRSRSSFDAQVEREKRQPRTQERAWRTLVHLNGLMDGAS